MSSLESAAELQELPAGTTVREVLDRQARHWTDRPALLDPRAPAAVTYRQLRDRAEAVAVGLARRGVAKGDKVATILENGAAAIESFLGIQYGGFVAAPLNPAAAPDELRQLLDHSDARAVFGGSDTLARLDLASRTAERPLEVITTDMSEAPIGRSSPEGNVALAAVRPGDEAVLDYTSGSSGTPKGVIVTHRNVLASANIHCAAQQMTASDRALLVLPLFHMNAQHVTLLSTLVSGGSLVIPKRFVPSEFWGWIEQYQCTWFAAVPTILEQLLHLSPTATEATGRGRLRFARSSAAPLSETLHLACEERFRIPIMQAMGMTEAGGTMFFNPLPPERRKYGSIGRPVGYETRVLDGKGQALGAGMPGRIQVRGAPVMRRYYKNPALTDTVLSADGWLDTGDTGYYDDQGFFFVSGRAKEIIKKGGQNIALQEIDELLQSHPGILESATIGVPDALFGEELFSFVVRRVGSDVEESKLRDFCRSRLGASKCPVGIAFVDSLPRNATGKLLRRELAERYRADSPAPTASKDAFGAGSVPAIDDSVEQRLLSIWQEALHVSPIGPHDNFFDLGGASVSAVEMLLAIEKQFGRTLPVSTLFECPTVAALAHRLRVPRAETWSSVVAIKPDGGKPPFFGIYAVDHVLFYYQLARCLDSDQPFYGVQSVTMNPELQLPERLEELATLYVRDLKAVQPHGPYLLGGQCAGAKIALEMAFQLAAAGEEVPLLVVFDSSAPKIGPAGDARTSGDAGRRVLNGMVRQGKRALALIRDGKIRDRTVKLASWFLGRADAASRNSDADAQLDEDAGLRAIDKKWMNAFVPKRFPGRITLIRSEQFVRLPRKQAGADRWKNYAGGGLEVHVVPGGHISMFSPPQVEKLAQCLQRCIAAAGACNAPADGRR